MSNTLTSTRLATQRTCHKKHYFRYELGLSRVRSFDALRIGGAFHLGMESGNVDTIIDYYTNMPDWADHYDWAIERETVAQLLLGHFWRYENDDVTLIEAEQVFRSLKIVNPHTGRTNRTFTLGGKIDAIVRLADLRLAVREYKTCGEDIGPDSDYWLRLRCDAQISLYFLAAQQLGYDVSTVLYDVTRKPTISPYRATPIDKRKYTKENKLYANQREADETPAEFGARLHDDIRSRPDFYYQRREIPRLQDELDTFQIELWQQADQIREARRHNRWFRNVGPFTCGHCEFAQICLNNVRVEPGMVPSGFEIIKNVHPELGDELDDSNNGPTETSERFAD